MKIQIAILFALSFSLHTAMAQGFDEPKFKKFGFLAGTNFSHINFSRGYNTVPLNIETTWNTGINLGFLMVVPITDKLFFQPEYLFTQTGGEIKTLKTTYKLNYFSLPVLLKYQLSGKFSLMAGPQIDLLIDAKRTINGSSTDITHDTEERSIGASAGIGYRVLNSLSVDVRYIHGLNHIGFGQRSNIQEFKYEMLQVSACINF